MWRDILDYGRRLLELTQTVENNKKQIKELNKENKQLVDVVRNLAYKHENEIASLRLEMQHLRETKKRRAKTKFCASRTPYYAPVGNCRRQTPNEKRAN